MAGVCRLGDKSKAPLDAHGCPACPHPEVQGPSIVASANVFINGQPGLRVNDLGIHTACCAANMWMIAGASGQVFLNGAQLVRKGDPTLHCGGPGKMIEASGNVHDGSPMVPAGKPGANPIMNLEALAATTPFGGPSTAPGAELGGGEEMESRVAEFARELGTEAARATGGGGIGAVGKVIEKKVIELSEEKGVRVPSGARTAAKAFKWGGRGVDMALSVAPDLVHGDTHDALKHAVSTGAGIAAGSAVGAGCEAGAIVGTAGLGTPVCVGADMATSTAVSFGVSKVYDPVVHAGGKVVHAGGKAAGFVGKKIGGIL